MKALPCKAFMGVFLPESVRQISLRYQVKESRAKTGPNQERFQGEKQGPEDQKRGRIASPVFVGVPLHPKGSHPHAVIPTRRLHLWPSNPALLLFWPLWTLLPPFRICGVWDLHRNPLGFSGAF